MKKIISILFGAGMLLGSMTSCDAFLQKDPPSSPSESIFWKQKADFDAALAGCYSMLYSGEFSEIFPCLDNLTDNTYCEHDEATYGKSQTMAQGVIDPTTGGFVSGYYNNCYKMIARIHSLMKNLSEYQGADMTETDKNLITGQCKALRGMMYSYLYLLYREVPLVTESLDLSNMYQPKAARADIYKQIMSDFDESISLLPDKTYSEFPGRLTQGAVKIMKSRILLNDAYQKGIASDQAKLKEVVSTLESVKGYKLNPSMRNNFLSDKQSSSEEIIFSVRYLMPNLTNALDLFYGNWHATCPTQDLIKDFECKDGLPWGESEYTVDIDEQLLVSQTPEGQSERKKWLQNRDPRMDISIIDGIGLYFPDEGYSTIPTVTPSPTLWNTIKLVGPQKQMITWATVSDADIVLIRYAEVLLMIAEAENELNGPTQKVYDAVNTVRARSHMPVLPAGLSKEDMRERIRHEWRVEYCFEGHRYFQLKRWNLMEKEVNGCFDPAIPEYVKKYEPSFEFWPLPQTEIDKSHGILVQDPNYI